VVAHVLRLRLALLLGTLRDEPRRVTRAVAGLIVLAAAVAVGCWALLSLTEGPTATLAVVSVIGGAAVMLAFALGPVVAGGEDPLDARRFAVFGIAPGPLAAATAVAGFVSVPVAALVPLGVCLVVAWDAHGVPWPLGVVAVAAAVIACSLFARVAYGAIALVARGRRSWHPAGGIVVALLAAAVPVAVFVAAREGRAVPAPLQDAANVLALTPLGAAWAILATDAGGRDALGPALIAAATVVVLAALWVLLVRRLLTTSPRPVTGRERAGLGWFRWTPGTAGGAVAARSLVYWLRDSRYLVNIVIVPIAAALTILPLAFVGVPAAIIALVPVPLMALFLGWLPHNDIAYDFTAVWMHIAAAVRGTADRIGRLAPILLLGVPLLAVAIPVAVWAHGSWDVLPAMIGVCASLFLSGLGLSSIASAAAPYAVSRPGDSPFQQPQRTGGSAAQALVLLGAIVVSVPALWWGWLTLQDDTDNAWPALWSGLGTGVVVLALGVLLGGWIFSRGSSRLMEFAEAG
jgi:ABC-2 type transport system permease protein